MPKVKNSKTKALAIFLAIAFLFSPFSFGGTNQGKIKAEESEIIFPDSDKITEISGGQHFWNKDDNIEIDGAVVIKKRTMLMIEPGATIKFKRNEGEIAPFIFVEDGGMLLAEGTESEKIVFTSDQDDSHFSIVFDGTNDGYSYSGFLRYVEVSKAGGEYEIQQDDPPSQTFLPLDLKRAFAQEAAITDYRFPVRHQGGTLVMENCRFFDNHSADVYISESQIDPNELNGESLVRIVNSNFESNQSGIAIRDDHTCLFSEEVTQDDCENVLMLKNNYYGKPTGPYPVKNSYQYYLDNQDESLLDDQFGGKIIGANLVFHGFRSKDLIVDPLIVIPGIMGSEKGMIGDDLQLDPILHTYDDLVDSLQSNGYEKNINLFEFPYQWRNSNVDSAQKLGEKIDDLRENLLVERFDIVAHSMGGLVTRQYIQSNQYHWGIDQFITLGTPHHGSPKAYLQWEAAEGFFGLEGLAMKHHFRMEALHSGYLSLFKYIREKVSSVGELLPDYDYLEQDGQMRTYPEKYPENIFLENLNVNNLEKLEQIRSSNIIGNLSADKTIAKIKVTDETDGDKWEYGKPINFDTDNYGDGLMYSKGDETVPLSSAKADEYILPDNTMELNFKHSELPSQAQCEVFRKLSGNKVCIFSDKINIKNYLLFNLFSPIDIQIEDPDGLKIGKDFAAGKPINQLKDQGAYYSGFEMEDGSKNENEFITIPNPKNGKYQILTEGTGSGDYIVEVALITRNDDIFEGAEESTVIFEGQTQEGEMIEKKIEVEGKKMEEAEEQLQDQTPAQIIIVSPENGKTYQNTEEILIQYTIADDLSAPENIDKKITLDGEKYDKNKIELWMQKTGEHEFAIQATDEAENQAAVISRFENKATFASLAVNAGKYHDLGMIKSKGETRHLQLKLIELELLQRHLDWFKEDDNKWGKWKNGLLA